MKWLCWRPDCFNEAEVWIPDPNNDGEQMPVCGIHEPKEDS